MTAQANALALADLLEAESEGLDRDYVYARFIQAAGQLRLLHAENKSLKQTLNDELDGKLRLRELGRALPTEPMTTFLERVFAERDALLEALKALDVLFSPLVKDSTQANWIDKARAAIAKAEGRS